MEYVKDSDIILKKIAHTLDKAFIKIASGDLLTTKKELLNLIDEAILSLDDIRSRL